jgi:cold shock CspA family protein
VTTTPAPTSPQRRVIAGVVRHWNQEKGFGKIASGRCEFFAHRTELIDVADLVPGQVVEFTPTDAPRGPRAIDVRPRDSDVRA